MPYRPPLIAETIGDLKAAPTSNITVLYDTATFSWMLGDFTDQDDDINIIEANGVPLITGAWVRQNAEKITDAARISVLASQDGAKGVGTINTRGGQAVFAQPVSVDDLFNIPRVNIRQFAAGPVELENAFDLLNKATGADLAFTGNNSDLPRCIDIDVPLVFPAEDRSVFVPRGMILNFANGRQMDLSATVANTKDVFVLGKQADGSANPGGLPPRILYLNSLGGPASAAVIGAQAVQGYTILAPFCTAAGIALDLRGSGDGIIDMVQADGCLIGVAMGGQNNNIGLMNAFNSNIDVLVDSDTFDCGIGYLHSEYYKYASVQIANAATNIMGFRIGTHKGIQNAQYPTSQGFVDFRSNGAVVTIDSAEYRNGKGAAIRVGTGVGNELIIGHLLVDGRKTNPLYDQSTDMAAVEWQNGTIKIKSMDAQYLQGQPVRIQGTLGTFAKISNADFEGCTGGTHEILMATDGTTTGAPSLLRLRAVDSSRGVSARYSKTGTATIEDDLA